MTGNNLKNMIENHKLDNLMANREELEKLKSSKTTEQVLEILNKYNYKETKEVFERELLEILQSIKLDDENMHNVSGGRLMNTKNLSMVLGSLMALNSAGFMSAGAVTEKQKNTEKSSVESLLNKVDKKTVMHIGLGASVVGSLWALKEIVTPRRDNTTLRDNTTFKLNSNQQKIYDKTKQLIDMILTYVENYITKNETMPKCALTDSDPEQEKILEMIESIRNDWLNMYENKDNKPATDETTEELLERRSQEPEEDDVWEKTLNEEMIQELLGELTEKTATLNEKFTHGSVVYRYEDLDFLALLLQLSAQFRWDFLQLTKRMMDSSATQE